MIASATECPRCTATITHPATFTPKLPRHGLAIGIFAAIFLGMFGHYMWTRDNPNADQRAEVAERAMSNAADRLSAAHIEQAKVACKRFIERALHDSTGAEWPPMREFAAERLKENVFRVQAQIRAKNAFNATRLATFDCVVMNAGDTWEAIRIQQIGLP